MGIRIKISFVLREKGADEELHKLGNKKIVAIPHPQSQ
jgi:hypothetical protein